MPSGLHSSWDNVGTGMSPAFPRTHSQARAQLCDQGLAQGKGPVETRRQRTDGCQRSLPADGTVACCLGSPRWTATELGAHPRPWPSTAPPRGHRDQRPSEASGASLISSCRHQRVRNPINEGVCASDQTRPGSISRQGAELGAGLAWPGLGGADKPPQGERQRSQSPWAPGAAGGHPARHGSIRGVGIVWSQDLRKPKSRQDP